MSHSKRMEKIQLVSMMFVFFGLLALAVPLVGSQLIPRAEVQSFQAPGRAYVRFEGAGPYIIYYEQFIEDEKAVQQREERALEQLGIDVFKSSLDEKSPLSLTKAQGKHHYSAGRRKGISLYTFEVKETGDYRVNAYYRSKTGPTVRLTLGQGSANSDSIRLAIIVMLAVVGAAIVLTMILFVIKILGS